MDRLPDEDLPVWEVIDLLGEREMPGERLRPDSLPGIAAFGCLR